MSEFTEQLRVAADDGTLCEWMGREAVHTIERLENEALAYDIRMDNDAMTIEDLEWENKGIAEWRDAYINMRDQRDEYMKAADTQAAAHKVERDALAQDAARYRWIVAQIVGDTFECLEDAFGIFGDADGCEKHEFDACIDNAMKETP